MPAFVFDLGGTHLRCAVADRRDGTFTGYRKVRVATFLDGLTPAEIATEICAQIDGYIGEAGNAPGPIVLAFPGPIARRRTVLSAPTLYGPPTTALPDIAALLTARTGRDVHLLNDVSAAAWALSARTDAARFLTITISSGIGSKLFDRDHPLGVLDDPPSAGEIGHFVVDSSTDAIACDCGGRGHLGGIASGRGVERLARRMRGDDRLRNEQDIVPAIRQREPWAIDVLQRATEPLARAILAVSMATGLDRVFIIGGFAQAIGEVYAEVLRTLVHSNSQYAVVADSIGALIELVGPDDEMCLAGAALFATRIPQHP